MVKNVGHRVMRDLRFFTTETQRHRVKKEIDYNALGSPLRLDCKDRIIKIKSMPPTLPLELGWGFACQASHADDPHYRAE